MIHPCAGEGSFSASVSCAPAVHRRFRANQAFRHPSPGTIHAARRSFDTNWNVSLKVYDAAGQRVESSLFCIIDRYYVPTLVRDLMVLEPGESREFTLEVPCGGMPRLPVGRYQVHATYHNAPDFPSIYDVYEDEARESWDGRIETAQTVTVLPLDRDTERLRTKSSARLVGGRRGEAWAGEVRHVRPSTSLPVGRCPRVRATGIHGGG
jgi:hypothetical protein